MIHRVALISKWTCSSSSAAKGNLHAGRNMLEMPHDVLQKIGDLLTDEDVKNCLQASPLFTWMFDREAVKLRVQKELQAKLLEAGYWTVHLLRWFSPRTDWFGNGTATPYWLALQLVPYTSIYYPELQKSKTYTLASGTYEDLFMLEYLEHLHTCTCTFQIRGRHSYLSIVRLPGWLAGSRRKALPHVLFAG